MYRTLLLTLSCAALAVAGATAGCDEGSYNPNSDPLGVQPEQSEFDSGSDETSLPTLSDIEEQENEQQPGAD